MDKSLGVQPKATELTNKSGIYDVAVASVRSQLTR